LVTVGYGARVRVRVGIRVRVRVGIRVRVRMRRCHAGLDSHFTQTQERERLFDPCLSSCWLALWLIRGCLVLALSCGCPRCCPFGYGILPCLVRFCLVWCFSCLVFLDSPYCFSDIQILLLTPTPSVPFLVLSYSFS
jgi:hypothetical protein